MKLVNQFTEIKEKADKRLTICEECDKYNPKTTRCSECGCFMRYKVMIPSSKCPIAKW
jgi:hypothetical protein